MELINEQIQHRQYGTGVIIEQTGTQISVRFQEPYGIKKFLCPMAFESYLVLCDLSLQKAVMAEIHAIHEKEATEKKQKEEATEQLREEKRLELLEQKRLSAKKRSPATKRTASTAKTKQAPPAKSKDTKDGGADE